MDVCAKLRGALREKRIGHSGTLDPMATGLLVVLLGRATRAAQYAEAMEKTYEARIRFGLVTDTQDTSGAVLQRCEAEVSDAALDAVLPRFRGEQSQLPPMYSALKVNGQKLYDLARKGREVERQPRQITVYALARTGRDENGDALLRVECSKGTYIRTLCHDIGQALGCGGCMASLRRTMAAGFDLSQAVTLEAVIAAGEQGRAAELLLPVDAYFAQYPALTVSGEAERRCRNGNSFRSRGEDGRFRVYGGDGAFLMLGERKAGVMSTVKSFFDV